MDGMITHQQLLPANQPGSSILQIIGEDTSVMMDLTGKKAQHQLPSDADAVRAIIGSYMQYGLIPNMTSPAAIDQPLPFQDGTDLRYVQKLAQRHGYVFYIIPGPAPGSSRAYWGPQIRQGTAQPALSINLGPATNVESLSFSYNALTPVKVSGKVMDRNTNEIQRIVADTLDGLVLSERSALRSQRNVRSVQLAPTSGQTYAQALARAQARTNAASNNTIVGEGQLDTLRYGGILEARRLVGVRGVGDTYDGDYYVKSVTHSLSIGAYKQSFTLLRQGIGTATPKVRPA